MLRFKKGVQVHGLQPEMLLALDRATEVYASLDKDCICTSARSDGVHSKHSHHYKGLAIDLRSRHLTEPEKIKVAERLQGVLGDAYQVISHRTHIHCEYDPEGP